MLIWIGLIAASIGITTAMFPKKAHFHHYFIGILLFLLCVHFDPIVIIVAGVAYGIFTEGTVRWKMDPVWEFSYHGVSDKIRDWKCWETLLKETDDDFY